MLKAKTLGQRVAMLSGNKEVYETVIEAIKEAGLRDKKVAEDENVEVEYRDVLIVITPTNIYAVNAFGTLFEDFSSKKCKLNIFSKQEKKRCGSL